MDLQSKPKSHTKERSSLIDIGDDLSLKFKIYCLSESRSKGIIACQNGALFHALLHHTRSGIFDYKMRNERTCRHLRFLA